jgi:hypothetical protein
MLWVEQAEVEDEHWLLWLLSPITPPSDDPVNPCSARILFKVFLLSLSKHRYDYADRVSTTLIEPASKEISSP